MPDLSLNQVDALLDALRGAPAGDDGEGGMTAPELAGLLGCSVEAVRKRIGSLKSSGKVRVVKVKRPRLDDIVHTVSGYRIAG